MSFCCVVKSLFCNNDPAEQNENSIERCRLER
uniref:Uncharacterized protein n=1 Tax=Anguilla anguilla TaxID=7936 RepID=A0A0E9SX14_ANGAN